MESIKVLITGAGGPGVPGIIRSLRLVKERKIKIIGVDADKESPGFSMADKHYLVPSAASKNFIKKLLKIATKEKVKVILPKVTRELIKLSKRREEFEKRGIKVSISDPEAIKTANNKYLLASHCQKNHIPVPRFFYVENLKAFKEACFNLGYPKKDVCLKPPVSAGMRGFRILTKKINRLDLLIKEKPSNTLTTLEEIVSILESAKPFPALLVMEYLPGKEYSVDILADNGMALVIVPRVREKIKMGVSFVGRTVNDEELIKYSKKIVSTLKLNGNIGLQFKKDKQGIPKLIECNPRLQGTTVLATAAGANLPYLAVKLALGERIARPKIKWGTKMIRYWQEIYYDKRGREFLL